jgi:hypothetical protein
MRPQIAAFCNYQIKYFSKTKPANTHFLTGLATNWYIRKQPYGVFNT